jgi:hypothetical protein
VSVQAAWTEDDLCVSKGELGQDLYESAVLRDWIDRQKIRLAAKGMTWNEWCNKHGVSDWSRKKLAKDDFISYAIVDHILTPAGMMVEDLYGWSRPAGL